MDGFLREVGKAVAPSSSLGGFDVSVIALTQLGDSSDLRPEYALTEINIMLLAVAVKVLADRVSYFKGV